MIASLSDLKMTPSKRMSPLPHNCHVHLPPNFCAFDSVADAVNRAAAEGLALLGASNYYWHEQYDQFTILCLKNGIFPLYGAEAIWLNQNWADQELLVNSPYPGRGYGLTIGAPWLLDHSKANDEAKATLAEIRKRDETRMCETIRLLNDHSDDLSLKYETIVETMARRTGADPEGIVLQERHLAQAAQEEIFDCFHGLERKEALARLIGEEIPDSNDLAKIQAKIRSALLGVGKPGYAEEVFLPPGEVKDMLTGFGGMYFHPVVGDSLAVNFESSELDLIENLGAIAADGVQIITVRNSMSWIEQYAEPLYAEGYPLTVGTEHNSQTNMPLTPTDKDGNPLTPRLWDIFWAGACLCAWWQVATMTGVSTIEIPENATLIGDSLIHQVHNQAS